MKNILLLIFTTLFVALPATSFGQDVTNSEKNKKISYAFINEYGGSYELPIGDASTFGGEIVGVFVNGIRFNKTQDEIGIGIGTEFLFIAQAFPIFFNYRHCFPSKKKVIPLINIAVGTRLSRWADHHPDLVSEPPVVWAAGLYSTIAGGFRVKSFSFTAGVLLKSLEFKSDYITGVEIKMGLAF